MKEKTYCTLHSFTGTEAEANDCVDCKSIETQCGVCSFEETKQEHHCDKCYFIITADECDENLGRCSKCTN